MKDGTVLNFACFLHDLLTLCYCLLTKQSSLVTVAEFHDCLSSILDLMLKYTYRYSHKINYLFVHSLSACLIFYNNNTANIFSHSNCLSLALALIICRPGPKLKTVLGTNQYEGVSLKPCDDHSLNKSKDHLIDLLSKTIENRFGDINRGFNQRVTNFRYWPEADRNAGDLGEFLYTRLNKTV